jgi:hypothetical protein
MEIAERILIKNRLKIFPSSLLGEVDESLAGGHKEDGTCPKPYVCGKEQESLNSKFKLRNK